MTTTNNLFRRGVKKFITSTNQAGTKQLVIYIGAPNTDSDTLIFPVHNPESVQFIDVSNYRDLVFDVNYGFPLPMIMGSQKALLKYIKDITYKNYVDARIALTAEDINVSYSMPVANTNPTVNRNIADIMHEEATQTTGYVIATMPTLSSPDEMPIIAYTHDVNAHETGLLTLPLRNYHGLYISIANGVSSSLQSYYVYALDANIECKSSELASTHKLDAQKLGFDMGHVARIERTFLNNDKPNMALTLKTTQKNKSVPTTTASSWVETLLSSFRD